MPKLSILIATIGRRQHKFMHLLSDLLPQTIRHDGEVEVVAYWNNGERSIGEIRQALLYDAKGEYVCFIDDDDSVPEYYVREIMANLGKDYIGFQVKLYNDGTLMPPVFHSIAHKEWRTDYDGYYRGITHLNPIKRSIAVQGDFSISKDAGEDAQWSHSVAPIVKTENYINRPMYFYYHESMDTNFGSVDAQPKPDKTYERKIIDHPNFRYHPASKLMGSNKK